VKKSVKAGSESTERLDLSSSSARSQQPMDLLALTLEDDPLAHFSPKMQKDNNNPQQEDCLRREPRDAAPNTDRNDIYPGFTISRESTEHAISAPQHYPLGHASTAVGAHKTRATTTHHADFIPCGFEDIKDVEQLIFSDDIQ